jgi:hypothetical protein
MSLTSKALLKYGMRAGAVTKVPAKQAQASAFFST